MPFIQAKTNRPVSAQTEQALKTSLGEAIALIPGKTERWLMVEVQDNARLWFAGTDEPAVILEVRLFGGAADQEYDRLTARLTEIAVQQLDVPADRVYVQYQEVPHWGWNGGNF